jgi:hypothetical protein
MEDKPEWVYCLLVEWEIEMVEYLTILAIEEFSFRF